jgi:hypothetical protein
MGGILLCLLRALISKGQGKCKVQLRFYRYRILHVLLTITTIYKGETETQPS